MADHPRTRTRSLESAVLSSSSTYALDDLFAEVMLVSQVTAFDVMLLRDTDVLELDAREVLQPARANAGSSLDNRSLTRIMASSPWEPIADWILEKCRRFRRTPLRISALATYYPDIVSLSEKRRKLAVQALVNTIRIALKLRREELMTTDPIIEIVCGQILDTCECGDNDCSDQVIVSEHKEKHDLLLKSCRAVVSQCDAGERFALGLELEPGENYVLQNADSIRSIMTKIEADPILGTRVGLNLDIAHMIIAKVEPTVIADYLERVVHAHIADHPGVHTRDQYVGKYTPVQQIDRGGYRPYFELLWKRLECDGAPLPFSGAVAVELEGCNRSEWMYSSSSAMRHLIAASR